MSSQTFSSQSRSLSRQGPQVSAIGLGLGSIGGFYGPPGSLDAKVALLSHAHSIGLRFWDAADVYGDVEDIIGAWIRENPEKRKDVVIASKFGLKVKDQASGGGHDFDSSPEWVRTACEKSLRRLGIDYIDLYYCHRVDGKTPIEHTIRAMLELKQEGKIKHLGLSECSPATLRRAVAVHPIAAMEMEYSLFCLDIEKNDILKTCRELGVSITAYAPIGRGVLSGTFRSQSDIPEYDLRRFLPKYSEENFPKIMKLVNRLEEIARLKGATAAQVALGWLLAQGSDIVPIPGTKRSARMEENLKAADVVLSEIEVKELRTLAENMDIQGTRHSEA